MHPETPFHVFLNSFLQFYKFNILKFVLSIFILHLLQFFTKRWKWLMTFGAVDSQGL